MAVEKTRQVIARNDYKCDCCELGYMQSTSVVLMSYPPRFVHKCTECNNTMNLDKSYPNLEYENGS